MKIKSFMSRHWYIAFQVLNGNVITTGFYVLEASKVNTSKVTAYIQSKHSKSSTVVLLNIFEISTADYNSYPEHCKLNI